MDAGADRKGRGTRRVHFGRHVLAVGDAAIREFRRSDRRRTQQGAGGIAQKRAQGHDREEASARGSQFGPHLHTVCEPAQGRHRAGRAGRPRPRRRRGDRRRRVDQRSRHHGRKRAGDSSGGQRFQHGHRRYGRAFGLDRRADQRQSGRSVSRSHDRHGRRREAAEDPERNRADDPAGRDDARLPVGDRDAASVFDLQRRGCQGWHADYHHRSGRATCVPHPDDHRRPALGDRRRGHGANDACERHRDVRARHRSGGRLRRAAARQDRHDYARQPSGFVAPSADRRYGATTRRGDAACVARRRDAGRQEHRRFGEARVRPRAAAARAGPVHDCSVLGAHADERRHLSRPRSSQRRARRDW